MGLFFTLIYVFTAYIGPPILFGDMAQYHIELVIALLALIFTLPQLQDSELLSIPQTYGILGLSMAVALSVVFSGWASGGPTALLDFVPNAIIFFFVALNCKKKGHLQLLIAVLLATALYTIRQGYASQQAGLAEGNYIITMKNGAGEVFTRIRGMTFLNDPNDFSQFVVGLIPCMFFFWRKGSSFRNLFLVVLPVSVLLFGMYLTHSRGGMIALMAAAIVAGRKKFGVVRSLVVGVVLFLVLSVVGWSGGRDVSAESGADRMDAWAAGLAMIRTHPIFGVGFRRFTDYHYLTAHNTVIVCAAETGLVGLFFWMLFIYPTIRDAFVGGSITTAEAAEPEEEGPPVGYRMPKFKAASQKLLARNFSAGASKRQEGRLPMQRVTLAGANSLGGPGPQFTVPASSVPTSARRFNFPDPMAGNDLSPAEIQRMLSLLLVSFAGFLTAGWFLSRAYTMTLFLNAGMVAAVYSMARKKDIIAPPMSFGRASRMAAIACVFFVALVWIILRVDHL